MNQKNETFIMRPGDTFVADECGCSFTVESGPGDESMAKQAPTCCCGHTMHKQGYGNISDIVDEGLHAMRGGIGRGTDDGKHAMSEMTMPDTEAEPEEIEDPSEENEEKSIPGSGADDDVNTALTDDSNQDGDPNDDRMGAPPMMPD